MMTYLERKIREWLRMDEELTDAYDKGYKAAVDNAQTDLNQKIK